MLYLIAMTANFMPYAVILCLLLILTIGIWVLLMELRLKKLFRSKKGDDLETILSSINEDLKNLHGSQEQTENYLKEIEERIRKSLKKVGFIRFNPYGESGSNQSFSIALLDEQGNGAVISVLYTRENVKVYAKPVQNYKSEHNLSEEENKAIMKNRA